MKKRVFRKLRAISNKVLGEKQTNEIIENTIEGFKKEIKRTKTNKKKKSDK